MKSCSNRNSSRSLLPYESDHAGGHDLSGIIKPVAHYATECRTRSQQNSVIVRVLGRLECSKAQNCSEQKSRTQRRNRVCDNDSFNIILDFRSVILNPNKIQLFDLSYGTQKFSRRFLPTLQSKHKSFITSDV